MNLQPRIKPAYKNIPAIVFTIDDGYVPYFSVALTGLLKNSSADNLYDIVILYKEISEENKNILKWECEKYPNVSLRFFDIGQVIQESQANKLVSNIQHINEVAYYRLYIPDIFASYEKVIFLDADICIDGDVSGMYKIDLGDNYLAAVKACMAMYLQSYGTCVDQVIFDFARYTWEVLYMDGRNYFNAGVLIFNIRKILKDKKNVEFLSKLDIVQKMLYNDQDILNLCCKDRVKYIGCEWNYCAKFDHTTEQKMYDAMKNDTIKIYHYIGEDKPWINKERNYYNIFYTYAVLSPYKKFFLNVLNNKDAINAK